MSHYKKKRLGLKPVAKIYTQTKTKLLDVRAPTKTKSTSSGVKNDLSESDAESSTMSLEEDKRFIPKEVEDIIKEVLDAYLHNVRYDANSCSRLSQDMCAIIKGKVKELNYNRYKIVVQVMLGQDSEQSVHVASRCLWNHGTDNFAAATYRNSYIYAVGTVYGVYLE